MAKVLDPKIFGTEISIAKTLGTETESLTDIP
jgi:hypothetical protein